MGRPPGKSRASPASVSATTTTISTTMDDSQGQQPGEEPAAGQQPQIDLSDIAAQLQSLQSMVAQQQGVIEAQRSQVAELQGMVVQRPPQQQQQQGPTVIGRASPPDARNQSPFEAQRVAVFLDRRMKGMYDARFHSTHA